MPADSPQPRPATPTASPPSGRSLIGPDMQIKGDVIATGTVEVLGEVDGKIDAHAVVLGPEGRIHGSVSADTVELRGHLEGRISCLTLTIRAAARVKADVNYRSLSIESGAGIEGRFTRAQG
jgi:cytoskeletal protein CcmA (bactofilin family)